MITFGASAMGTVRKTISLTDQQDAWIKAQIDAGRYTNDSEYIRDLIRREQERSLEIEAIRSALIDGENSGKPQPFDSLAFKKRMTAQNGLRRYANCRIHGTCAIPTPRAELRPHPRELSLQRHWPSRHLLPHNVIRNCCRARSSRTHGRAKTPLATGLTSKLFKSYSMACPLFHQCSLG